MLTTSSVIPYPHWLNPADNSWQLICATLVGLMSIPGLAVFYAGLVRNKWIVNTMLMVFTGFSVTLVVWMLWGYNMAFGQLSHFGPTGSFWSGFIGHATPLATASSEQGQTVSGANTLIPFHFPTATFAYFQFTFDFDCVLCVRSRSSIQCCACIFYLRSLSIAFFACARDLRFVLLRFVFSV